MVDFNTPQSKVVKELCDAYASLDIRNVEPFLSKNYGYDVLPKCTDFPSQMKEGHLQAWGGILSSLTELEVSIRHRRTTLKFMD